MFYARYFVYVLSFFISLIYIEQYAFADNDISIKSENSIKSPTYLPWNSFFSMLNVLELENVDKNEATINVEVFNQAGKQLGDALSVSLASNSKFDVLLGNITEHEENAYGIIKLSYSDTNPNVNARLVQYRNEASGSLAGINSITARGPITGNSFVPVNTFMPNLGVEPPGAFVANWLTLINTETTDQIKFTLNYRDSNGVKILSRDISLGAGSRLDIEGGHESLGRNNIGSIEVIPQNDTHQYLAHLSRYGKVKDQDNIRHVMTFPATAKNYSENMHEQYFISSQAFKSSNTINGTTSYIEIINPDEVSKTITISLIEPDSKFSSPIRQLTIPPMSVKHVNPFMFSDQVVKIESDANQQPVIAYGTYYNFQRYLAQDQISLFNQHTLGFLVSSYALLPVEPSCVKYYSMNTFLDQENIIRLFNLSNETADYEVSIFNPSLEDETLTRLVKVSPLSNLNMNIKDIIKDTRKEFSTLLKDNYAIVRVRSVEKREAENVQFVLESVRVKYHTIPGYGTDFFSDFILPDTGWGDN